MRYSVAMAYALLLGCTLLSRALASVIVLTPELDDDGYGLLHPETYGNNTILQFNQSLSTIRFRSRYEFHVHNLTIDCVSGRARPLLMRFDDDDKIASRLRLFGNNSRVVGCQLHIKSTYGISLSASNGEVDGVSITGTGNSSYGIWVDTVGNATVKASNFTSLFIGVNINAASSVRVISSAFIDVNAGVKGLGAPTSVHNCSFVNPIKLYAVYLVKGGDVANCSFGHIPGCPMLSKSKPQIPAAACLPAATSQYVKTEGGNISIVNNTFVINIPRAGYSSLEARVKLDQGPTPVV